MSEVTVGDGVGDKQRWDYAEWAAVAGRVDRELKTSAATWTEQFEDGSGEVITVSDAAVVVAKMVEEGRL